MDLRITFTEESRPQPLAGGGDLVVPFTAAFSDQRVRATLLLDIANGQPVCRKVVLTALDPNIGIEGMTTEVMRGLDLRKLMSHACLFAVQQLQRHSNFTPANTIQAVESLLGSAKNRRAPVTNDELQEFADAYLERYVPSRMSELAGSLHISERTAWRRLRAARERGILATPEEG